MAKRTSVMHDDIGVVVGPDLYKRYRSLDELVNAVGSQVGSVFISARLEAFSNVVVPANLWLIFTGDGKIVTTGGASVTIEGCVLAPMQKRIFVGSVSLRSDCMYSQRWWGLSGGWVIPTLYGDLTVNGDVAMRQLTAESAYVAGCKVLTICGNLNDPMTGRLILNSADPLYPDEAVSRRWVLEQLTHGGFFDVKNYSKITFVNGCDATALSVEPLNDKDELTITLDAAINMKAVHTSLEKIYAHDGTDPTTPVDDAAWWAAPGVSNIVANPVLKVIGDPGITLQPCP